MAYKNYEDHKRNVRERLAALTPEERASRALKKKEWRERNKERLAEKEKQHYEENKDKILEGNRIAGPVRRFKFRLKKYGLTPEKYTEMQISQRHRCAICRRDEAGGRGRWHIDHCHETGKVRGLLCSRCNVGLGLMFDSVDQLRRAAAYLERHKQ